MKYYIIFSGYEAPYQKFKTLKEARKYMAECKRDDKLNSPYKLKDEYQGYKNSYRLMFGCNLYSAASIHKCND